MALLGEDGRGYELARKLEVCGVWRSWLGDSCYGNFAPYLNSSTTWEAFMRVDESKSRAQIHLQLRVRALLFDKATVSLSLRQIPSSSSLAVSKLNPSYLQLHGDDVYYTLENSSSSDVPHNTTSSKMQTKSAFGVGLRYSESEVDNMTQSQRFRSEGLPETWHNQFIEKYRVKRPYRLSLGDQESDKRTADDMSTYLRLLEKNKKRCVPFKEDQYLGYGNPNFDDDESLFFPEIMFTLNSVPDSALPTANRVVEKPRLKVYGVLDTLPRVMTRTAASIERFGINGVNKKGLGEEQASLLCNKVIARMLTNMGFEGSTELPVEIFSQLMSCHVVELGRILKVLSDNYRKQCSAVELIKMFIQSMKCDFGTLVEHVKDGSRNSVQQSQQQLHVLQSQMTPQAQVALRLQQQQISRQQIHPHMQQFVQSQSLAFQQQQQQHLLQQQQQQQMLQQQQQMLRRRQTPTPRPATSDSDKERAPLLQVKTEQQSDVAMDANAFNSFNNRYTQMQFRQQQQQQQQQQQHQQQQLAAMSNFSISNAQSPNQFRPMASVQIPQMQSPGGVVRAPPVKVEGFQELMGGDTSSKHDSDENRLTSPLSK